MVKQWIEFQILEYKKRGDYLIGYKYFLEFMNNQMERASDNFLDIIRFEIDINECDKKRIPGYIEILERFGEYQCLTIPQSKIWIEEEIKDYVRENNDKILPGYYAILSQFESEADFIEDGDWLELFILDSNINNIKSWVTKRVDNFNNQVN